MKVVRLIRDSLGADYKGEPYETTQITEELKHLALVAKLHEEVAEIAKALDDKSEYADVLTALQALAKLNGVKWRHVTKEARRKHAERGGFAAGKVMIRRG